jgi:ribosomal-protein-alanine N-acetyltransferase
MPLGALFFGSIPFVSLPGAHVAIRTPQRGDWRSWSQLRGQSRAFLTPWEPSWSADSLTRKAFKRRLLRYAVDWRDKVGYSFFIVRLSDQALLGGITFSNIRRGVAETGSIGYWIGQPYARQGYMTEALDLALHYGFGQLRLHRIEAACLPANIASRGLLAKTGFTEEGYARQYLFIDGAWADHMLYAILRDDWKARQPGR